MGFYNLDDSSLFDQCLAEDTIESVINIENYVYDFSTENFLKIAFAVYTISLNL